MVGGVIIEVIKDEDDGLVWVNCGGTRSEYKMTCAIWVDPMGNTLQPGDKLWWQGGRAFWTTRDKSKIEIVLPKLGFSGCSRPRNA